MPLCVEPIGAVAKDVTTSVPEPCVVVPFFSIAKERAPAELLAHIALNVIWYVPAVVKVMRCGFVVLSCIVSVSKVSAVQETAVHVPVVIDVLAVL